MKTQETTINATDNRDGWLEARKRGIGGSDAAAALGMSPWKTQLELYLEKRGELMAPDIDSEAMLWGRVLEPVIRQQYAERTGRTVRVPDVILCHPEHSFMLANLDGITDDGRVLEIKTARTATGWGDPGTDEIPVQYMLQVQHYMAVTGCVIADVAVLISGSDFRLYEVPANSEIHELMITGEADFWDRVQRGKAPEPVSLADMQAMFPVSRETTVEASDSVAGQVAELVRIRQQIKELEASEEQSRALVMQAMGNAEALIYDGETLATWKSGKGVSRFDSKAFQAAHPDLYGQFLKTGAPVRRFLLK